MFSQAAKIAAAVYQDQETAGMEADHIQPKSRGGADDVTNLQWIPADTNRQKGARQIQLRQWQRDFKNEWEKTKDPSFLCVAIPGAGKTVAALNVASDFLNEGSDRRIIIVVPTVNLRSQWQREAAAFGIQLQTQEFGANFKGNWKGGVTTYQSLDTLAQLFRKICATNKVLVILDEPHHCGDQASWGGAVKVAFENAERRLLLSGTPFRTDGTPIPFIKYDAGGFCLADFRYDYPHALRDSVVRSFNFDYSKGSFNEILMDGTEVTHEFHGELSEEEAAKRLRKILNPAGDFVAETIRMAHAKLQEVREHIPDAGAMAVCIDQTHATKIAEVIRKETGVMPSVVVSDSDIATDSVDAFRKSSKQWIVSVRQVSEGTDIKRLHVLAYMTSATTELFFRQLIGRVCRTRYQDDLSPNPPSDEGGLLDLEAFVYLPADPRLIAHAKNIEAAQMRALKELSDKERREMAEREVQTTFSVFAGSNHQGTDRIIVCGKEFEAAQAEEIKEIAAIGKIPMERAVAIYESGFRKGGARTPQHQEAEIEPEEMKLKKRRKLANALAFRLAKALGVEPAEINRCYKRAKDMTVEEVDAKIKDLQRRLSEVAA